MESDTSMKHVAFADDLSGAGDLTNVRRWWDNIVIYGPKLGYNPNAAKSWLIVKPETEEMAREIFRGTRIKITIEGRKYLGGFIEARVDAENTKRSQLVVRTAKGSFKDSKDRTTRRVCCLCEWF